MSRPPTERELAVNASYAEVRLEVKKSSLLPDLLQLAGIDHLAYNASAEEQVAALEAAGIISAQNLGRLSGLLHSLPDSIRVTSFRIARKIELHIRTLRS